MPAPEVSVVEAKVTDLPIYATYVGQAYGLSDVMIRARVQGLVTGLFFKEGAYVKKGDILYTIDDLPYKAKVAEADGRLADAQTELTRAKNDLARVEPLVSTNALSKRDLDAAKAAVGAAEGRVKAAKASKENAEIQLSFCTITAPISGLIGISQVRVGDLVSNIDNKPLNTISDLTQMRIRFPISENDYIHYYEKAKAAGLDRPGKAISVDLYLSDGSLYSEKGVFNVANREIDATTGSLVLEVLTPNPGNEIRPGQYVKVKFPSEMMKGAITIPQRAVQQIQNLFQVIVLGDSNKIVPKMVKVGPRVGESWVITDGLKQGDKIVLLGNRMVKPNTVVVPVMVNSDSLSNKQ